MPPPKNKYDKFGIACPELKVTNCSFLSTKQGRIAYNRI